MKSLKRSVSLLGLMLISTSWASELRIGLTPEGIDPASAQALTEMALSLGPVKQRLGGVRARVLDSRFVGSRFQLGVYDYSADWMLWIEGDFNNPEKVQIRETTEQPA